MEIAVKQHSWYHRQHHDGAGFKNPWGPPRNISALKAAGWLISHALRLKRNEVPPVYRPPRAVLAAPPTRLRITWIGHATTYIQTPRLDLLTDPIFSKRASPLPFAGPDRKPPLPLQVEDLPGVDAVLISHDHYDHLDQQTVRQLQERFEPLFLVPLGVGSLVRDWGAARVAELDWWQYVELHGMRYHCTPAKHFSGRGLTNRNGTLWASWYLEAMDGSLNVYYAGDTAYADHLVEIRDRLGAPEVAILPIGAYEPRWFMEAVHVDPEEAVRAFIDLQARHFIPIHWGTFDLAAEATHEPAVHVQRCAAEQHVADRLHLLEIGGHFSLDRTAVPPPSVLRSRPSRKVRGA